jgi:MYXO-CTERM domain-containing protein
VGGLRLSIITPQSGSEASDTTVALIGDGFVWGTKGALGANAFTLVEYQSPGLLKAVVPKGLVPGLYDVTVVNPDGREARMPAAFTVTKDTTGIAGGCGCDGTGGAPWAAVLLLVGAAAGRRR